MSAADIISILFIIMPITSGSPPIYTFHCTSRQNLATTIRQHHIYIFVFFLPWPGLYIPLYYGLTSLGNINVSARDGLYISFYAQRIVIG